MTIITMDQVTRVCCALSSTKDDTELTMKLHAPSDDKYQRANQKQIHGLWTMKQLRSGSAFKANITMIIDCIPVTIARRCHGSFFDEPGSHHIAATECRISASGCPCRYGWGANQVAGTIEIASTHGCSVDSNRFKIGDVVEADSFLQAESTQNVKDSR